MTVIAGMFQQFVDPWRYGKIRFEYLVGKNRRGRRAPRGKECLPHYEQRGKHEDTQQNTHLSTARDRDIDVGVTRLNPKNVVAGEGTEL
jgi:hypothetical protein